MPAGKAARRWCCTFNEAALVQCVPDIVDLWADVKATWCGLRDGLLERAGHGRGLPIKFFGGQFERGEGRAPGAGNRHFQAYLVVGRPARLPQVKGLAPGAHLEIARGSDQQNLEYCNKEDTRLWGPFEHGDRALLGQGVRTDIAAAVAAIGGGADLGDYVMEHPGALKYWSSLSKLQASRFKHRRSADPPPDVYWCYGATGTGKSKWAAESCTPEEQYWKPPGNKWWDGYHQQSTIIIDDYRAGGDINFKWLLRLMDRNPLLVEVKHDFIAFSSAKIIITTPLSPVDTFSYRSEEDINQLLRRITEVKKF